MGELLRCTKRGGADPAPAGSSGCHLCQAQVTPLPGCPVSPAVTLRPGRLRVLNLARAHRALSTPLDFIWGDISPWGVLVEVKPQHVLVPWCSRGSPTVPEPALALPGNPPHPKPPRGWGQAGPQTHSVHLVEPNQVTP